MLTYTSAISLKEKEYCLVHQYRFAFLEEHIKSLHLPKGATVLDIGCYPPIVFNYLEQQGYTVYGVASSHEQLQSEKIYIRNIETDALPWQNNTFDLVVFTEVIEHLPHSPLPALTEMFRVLRPGGSLLITTPNATKLHHRLKLLFGKSTSFPLEQLLTVKPGNGSLYHLHNREYTMQELTKLLNLVGFEIAIQKHVCLYPPTRSKVAQEGYLSRTVKWAGFLLEQTHGSFKDSLFFLARKPS